MNRTIRIHHSRISRRRTSIVVTMAAIAGMWVIGLSAMWAANVTWDGGVGGTGTDIGVAANWSGDALPSATGGDTGEWNGTVAGNLSLLYTAANSTLGGAVGNPGISLSLTSSQTGALTLDSGTNTNAVRLNNITVALGAGAFTLGNGSNTFNITFGGGAGTRTLTNDSSNLATIKSDVRFAGGNAAAQTLLFTGAGNWRVEDDLASTNGATIGLTKSGAGMLTIAGTTTHNGFSQVTAGTLVVSGTLNDTGDTVSIGQGNNANAMATISGTVTTSDEFWVTNAGSAANTAVGVATVTGTVNSGTYLVIGRSGNSSSSGTLNLNSGGTLNIRTNNTTTGNLELADFDAASGTLNIVAGATVKLWNNSGINFANVNNTGTGTINQSGGSVTFYSNGGTTVGGTGAVVLGGGTSSGTYTYQLNGGTLTAPSVTRTSASGSGTFNFNGGTLKAAAASTAFMQGLTRANIRNGGALIDTNGFDVTMAQALVHSNIGGDNATDGGLTKMGAGALTLGGTNTYTGTTTINAGKLVVTGSIAGAVSLNTGTLDGTGTVGAVTVGAGTGGILANGNGSGSSLTASSLTFNGSAATSLKLNGGADVTTPAVVVTNGLSIAGGTVSVNTVAPVTSYVNGSTYKLFSYGTFAGNLSNFATGTIAGLTPRQTPQLGNSGSAITMTIVGDAPKWTGALSSVWSTATLAEPKNWKLITGGTTTDYLNGDVVLFDDTATGTAISINSANVSPTSTTFDNSSLNYTVSGSFGITGAGGLTKTGIGSLSVGSNNSYTGATTITRGTLSLTGSLGATAISISPAAGSAAVMNSSGTVAFGSSNSEARVGTVAGGTGVLNITGGSFGGGTAAIDAGIDGFGTINVTGGTVTPGHFLVAGYGAGGSAGIWNISGGSVSTLADKGGTLGGLAGTTGVMNVTGPGGYTSVTPSGSPVSGLYVGEAGVGVLNVSGSGTLTLGGTETAVGLELGRNNVNTSSGIVNLGAVGSGGGTITTNIIRHSGVSASGIFNFHGGTLKASSVSNTDSTAGSGNSFMGGLTNAYVYGEGGTIDNSGRSITITQSLTAPSSLGVTSIAVGSGGSGYVTAPLVMISGGGGTGATAIANISGAAIAGFTITNPGTGYTSTPTVTLTGGTDSGTAGSAGIVTRTANVSGGLIFVGNGVTILTGTNTYTGSTAVNAGTLVVSGGSALADSSAVAVASGATFQVSGSETIGSLAGSGNVIIGGTSQTLTVGAANTSTTFSGSIYDANTGLLTKTGTGTLTLTGISFYSGGTNIISGGVLSITDPDAIGTGNVTVGNGNTNNGGTLQLSNNIALTSAATIIGAGRNAFTSGGMATIENLSGNNSVSGNITFGSTGGTYTNIVSTAGNLTLSGNLTAISVTGSRGFHFAGAGNISVEGSISNGSASVFVEKSGTGTATFATANTYTGGTTIGGGTLLVNNTSGSGTGTGAVTVNSGTLGGSGFITSSNATVTVGASGSLAPGHSAGTLTFALGTGSLNLSAITAGGLKFELGAPDAPSASDHIVLSSGVLNIGTLDFSDFSFTNLGGAAVGTYNLFDAASPISGSIGAAGGTFAGLTATLSLDNTNNDVLLRLTDVLGDYNVNNVVDAADYVLWRKTVQPLPNELAAPIGTTDAADYDAWQTRFGNISGSGAEINSVAAVPEPATVLLVALAILMVLFGFRNR
jgi:fibronectin-binding autotransporter adhesin